MANYADLLKRPEWIQKRNHIEALDGHRCARCQSNEELHVHHVLYLPGRLPWEYEDKYLITFCEPCHWGWHVRERERTLDKADYLWPVDETHRVRRLFAFEYDEQVKTVPIGEMILDICSDIIANALRRAYR